MESHHLGAVDDHCWHIRTATYPSSNMLQFSMKDGFSLWTSEYYSLSIASACEPAPTLETCLVAATKTCPRPAHKVALPTHSPRLRPEALLHREFDCWDHDEGIDDCILEIMSLSEHAGNAPLAFLLSLPA